MTSPERTQRRRGSAATTLAVTLIPMLGFVSMGVDWGHVSAARFALRAVADEAALAAASTLSDSPKTTQAIAAAFAEAQALADAYTAEMAFNGLEIELDSITFGYYDKTTKVFSTSIPSGKAPNAVQAWVSADVYMPFASILGIETVHVATQAKAGAAVVPGRAPDLVIVQDVTPSMNSSDISNSKIANRSLVECIEANAHKSTRGGMIRFGNKDAVVADLESYEEAPGVLLKAARGTSPSSAYSSSGVCVGNGGCTAHSSGMYAAVDLLNDATAPPEDVGQAIIFITDGAPATGHDGCTAVASSSWSATDYQKWLVGNSSNRCGKLAAQTTSTNCANVGGRWDSNKSPKCRPSDNGAEGDDNQGPGRCSLSAYSSEARCEGNGGTWRRSSGTTANPSTLTQWTDQARAMALAGTHGPIDVYAVYYSAGASGAYKNDNLKFLRNHVVTGKGAELGVLDAPTGAALTAALEDLCVAYAVGSPGLID